MTPMKTALIMTTINIPTVLIAYRSLLPLTEFFIVGDKRTQDGAEAFCKKITNCHYYGPDAQEDLGYECSPVIGWNTIARRNIALLEAVKSKADVILSIDDDNIPMSHSWGYDLYPLADGIIRTPELLIRDCPWFDPGQLSFPQVVQRGFPQQIPRVAREYKISHVVNPRISIVQGAILGDPDTSAIDRISQAPSVHQVSELARVGVCIDPRDTNVPLNSQNIMFRRELAHCFLMVPQFGRYDDIFAGFIAQQYCAERGLLIRYGQPFVWQQRNRHFLLEDLKAEMWGADNCQQFLNNLISKPAGTLEMWRYLQTTPRMPAGVADLAKAWLNDIEKVAACPGM